jgi:hypothetical protein
METYQIYSRGDEKCWLADSNALTLALSDCADADNAENIEEMTAQMLAEAFSFDALLELALQREKPKQPGGMCAKLTKAIRLAAQMEAAGKYEE